MFAAFGVFVAASFATVFEPWVPITGLAWAALLGSVSGDLLWLYRQRDGDPHWRRELHRAVSLCGPDCRADSGICLLLRNGQTLWRLIGAGVIVGTGAFTLYRQRALRG